MDLTLVVLAAGLGSRFGGAKQLEPVSPGGATLMDYAVWDAARAGFGKAVLVVAPDLDDGTRNRLEQRYAARLRATTVAQPRAEGRARPWGTAHAVLAARREVAGPFAAVNGDDFYGATAWRSAASFLGGESGGSGGAWGLAGYRLADTLSPHGGVNRAICRMTQDGWLQTIEEIRDIHPGAAGLAGTGPSGPVTLSGDELVSMNFWAFTASVFDLLEEAFERFIASAPGPTAELLLPDVIRGAVEEGRARVQVLEAGRDWFGLTHPADRDAARASLGRLVASGEYPERPWP